MVTVDTAYACQSLGFMEFLGSPTFTAGHQERIFGYR
jgi:hypothetical protein